MKNSVKTAFVFCLCALFSISTFANNGGKDDGTSLIIKTKIVDADHVKVHLANLNQGTTYVSIKGLDGKVFYSERIVKHNGYLKTLDISELPNDRYVLEVLHDGKQYKKVILVDEKILWLSQLNIL